MLLRISFFILILFSGINASQAQKLTNPFEQVSFVGKVMKITEIDLIEEKDADSLKLDSLVKTISVFNEAGNVEVVFTYLDKDKTTGALILSNKQAYFPETDANGLIRKIKVKSNKGSNIINYDKVGRPMQSDSYNLNGNLMAVTYYKYDKYNNKKEIFYCNAAKNPTLDRKLKYDDKGNVIESDDYRDMSLILKTHYTYQDYDQAGNWLKRVATTHFENGTPATKRITERQISYY